ncbi:MAG: hypothetical protein PHR96_01835 [Clostridia bacterium]|nr:hypothetical protein [Clostridia bacterium]
MKTILELILQSQRIFDKAEKIALNPERSAKSKGYGITSIIFSILAIIGAVGLPFLCYTLFVLGLTTNLLIIGNIFLVSFAVTLLALPILLAFYAIIFSRAQRKINQLKINNVSKHLSRISMLLSLVFLIIVVIYVININQTA